MQYPVPQFTDVEDKLIGPLSIKQFFIIFMAGVLIFAGYSETKSLAALVILFLIFGLPALGLAFAKINGRPVYKQLPFLMQFFSAPKRLVFHKQALDFSPQTKMKDVEFFKNEKAEQKTLGSTQDRLKEVQAILKKQQEEEAQLVGKIR
ncbi:MAG: PrgI family protein [Candidatus Doudnabacteria bacterium]|nr:PrgI family protein [Candidatus Doudnabacteria bacterium]